jgi:hypothetical protein
VVFRKKVRDVEIWPAGFIRRCAARDLCSYECIAEKRREDRNRFERQVSASSLNNSW